MKQGKVMPKQQKANDGAQRTNKEGYWETKMRRSVAMSVD